MKEKIKISQFALITFIIMMGGKFLTLPAYLSAYSSRDAWVSCLILFAVDFVCFTFTLWAIKINKHKLSIEQILKNTIGTIPACILFVISLVFFFLRLMCQLAQSLELFSSVLTISTNWIAYALPLLAFAFYSIRVGFNNIARLSELLFFPIALSAFFLVGLSFTDVDTGNLLPFLNEGIKPALFTAQNNTIWFADYIFVLFIFDKLSVKKSVFAVPLLAFLFGTILITALVLAFTGIFGDIAWMQDIAIAKISQFVVADTSKGRIEWIALVFWLFSVFIKITVTVYCCIRSLNDIFLQSSNKYNWIFKLFILALAITLPLFIPVQHFVNDYFITGIYKYFLWLFTYLLPLFLPLLVFITNKKTKRNNVFIQSKYLLKSSKYDIALSTVTVEKTSSKKHVSSIKQITTRTITKQIKT